MQKLSSLVLDRYDDPDGLLSEVDMIHAIKLARAFTPEELSRLPDDTFALVVCNGETELRKFSMADRGNAVLSAKYFLKTGHLLPVEAQVVAADNLWRGLVGYGMGQLSECRSLEKIALGVASLIGGALVVPGAVREASNNLKAVQGAPGIMTPEQIKQRRLQMGV